MKNPPKIFIGAPTSEYKDYCFKAWSDHVKSLEYPNYSVFLVDNSDDKNYHHKIILHFNCVHLDKDPRESNQSFICRSQNMVREEFLKSDANWFFSLETDHFPPKDVIQRLLSLKRHVVGLPYFTGTAYESYMLIQEDEGLGIERQMMKLTVEQAFEKFDGTLKSATQIGIGCLLIHRSVMEKIKFRIDPSDPADAHSDTYFFNDLRKLRIPSYIDTSQISYHQNKKWFDIIK